MLKHVNEWLPVDSVASAMVSCPGGLASYFDVALDGPSITNCTNNTLDGRQNSFLTFNFSSCATGMANSEKYRLY